MDNIDDPYIHRLSEELHDLSILSDEIKKQNEYLSRLSQKTNANQKNCSKCKKYTKCGCSAVVTRTPNRTKSDVVGDRQNSRPVNEVSPCVNNSVNPALNNFSKTTVNSRYNNGSNVNTNASKFDENLSNGKRADNCSFYCSDGDQCERSRDVGDGMDSSEAARRFGDGRPLMVNGSSSESFDSSDKGNG